MIVMILLWGTFASRLTTTFAYDHDWRKNVSKMLKTRLEKDYDMRLRPNFSGSPLDVGLDLSIVSFDKISEVNMDYTITLNLHQYWTDTRLNFSEENAEINLGAGIAKKIWVPDTFLANDKKSYFHIVTEDNKALIIYGNGSIFYGMRFTSTLACMMDLHNYPLDSQNCTIEIESYGYTIDEVHMYWKKTPDKRTWKHDLPQFTLIHVDTSERNEHLATGTYQRLSLSFRMKRNIGYFLFQTYLPSILIVMLSWISFWINHEATSARVALGITTVLTMTTISTGVRSSLPRISYVKAIDIYLVMCFVFVFSALLEYAAVNYTYWGGRAKRKAKKQKNEEYQGPFRIKDDDKSKQQDIRLSPIPSLRSRQGKGSSDSEVDLKFPPSFRLVGVDHAYAHPHRSLYYAVKNLKRQHSGPNSRQDRVIDSFKKRANCWRITLPKIRDVNVIDKYSRIIFPTSFIVINMIYWGIYLIFN